MLSLRERRFERFVAIVLCLSCTRFGPRPAESTFSTLSYGTGRRCYTLSQKISGTRRQLAVRRFWRSKIRLRSIVEALRSTAGTLRQKRRDLEIPRVPLLAGHRPKGGPAVPICGIRLAANLSIRSPTVI